MRANHERVVRRAGLCPRIAKPRSLWQRQSWIAAALITGFGSLLILGLSQDSSAKEDVLSTLRSIPSATLSDAVDEVAGRAVGSWNTTCALSDSRNAWRGGPRPYSTAPA